MTDRAAPHPLDASIRILKDHIAHSRAGFEAEERAASGFGDQQRVRRLRSARDRAILLPRDCPAARQMGFTIKATHGTYVLEGEICGDQELTADAQKHHLDPRRLADAAQGWTLHRQPGDSSSRYTLSVRGAPAPRFARQRLEKHPEAGGGDRWVDVTATLQAGGRLRPKP